MAGFLPQLGLQPVTGSAFSIARYKIKPAFFDDFCRHTIRQMQEVISTRYWKGYRLYAGDGTTISVPVSKDTVAHFGTFAQTESGTKTVMASACMIYDVLSNYVVDAKIGGMENSEFTLLQNMLEGTTLDDNGILILDRGFSKFYFYKVLINKGIRFCIRQRTGCHDFSEQVLNCPEDDFITEWYPSEAERATCRHKGIEPSSIKVRVTKIALSSGETELLITNLFDQQQITPEDLKELYHFRWSIEEAFKQLKPQMKLEQFGCKKANGVYQEFYAHIIMLNITTLIAHLAEPHIEQQTQGRKYQYKYNRVNAWKFVRNKIIDLYAIKQNVKLVIELVGQIRGSVIAIVPNRSFPRDHRFKRKNRLSPMYK